ncbi:MAG: hypothetical protein Q8R25_03085 [bacterium]|nr:hypothetical protein [bacterium]
MFRIIFALLTCVFITQSARAEEFSRHFGEWRLHCFDAKAVTHDNCFVMQQFATEGYMVRVIVQADETKQLKMQFILPANARHSRFLNILTDTHTKWKLAFIRQCWDSYCESVPIGTSSFPKERLIIGFDISPGDGIRMDIPMDGFNEAISALSKRLKIPSRR